VGQTSTAKRENRTFGGEGSLEAAREASYVSSSLVSLFIPAPSDLQQLSLENKTEFAEVLYYFKCHIGAEVKAFTLVILFSPSDMDLLVDSDSEWTVWSVVHMGAEGLRAVDAKSIAAVVSMQPHDHHVETDKSDYRWLVWEREGIEVGIFGGYSEEPDIDDEEEAEREEEAE
jgi:hypothetical protein